MLAASFEEIGLWFSPISASLIRSSVVTPSPIHALQAHLSEI